MVLNTDEHHSYTGITVSEWGAANALLVAHSLQTDELAAADTDYYLAYTARYWECQCQHQFKFGYILSNMQLSLFAQAWRHCGPTRHHQGN